QCIVGIWRDAPLCPGAPQASFLLQESHVHSSLMTDVAAQASRQAWLSTQLATRVTIIWTDNRSSMLSARGNTTTGYRVRLHRIFGQAPEAVWCALVVYLRNAEAAACRTIRTYIRQQHPLLVQPQQPLPRTPLLQPHGRYFDLEAIYHDLNQRYFVNRVQAQITWSRRPPQRQRTSIRFGSYQERDRLIRI